MIPVTWSTYLIILLFDIFFAYYLKSRILKDTKVDGSLTQGEQIGVILTLIINVLIAGAIYYASLYKKLPKKNKEINKYVWIIFIIVLTLQFGLHFSVFSLRSS